jgi:hypothetical protein
VLEVGWPEEGALHRSSLGGLAWGPLLGGKTPRPTGSHPLAVIRVADHMVWLTCYGAARVLPCRPHFLAQYHRRRAPLPHPQELTPLWRIPSSRAGGWLGASITSHPADRRPPAQARERKTAGGRACLHRVGADPGQQLGLTSERDRAGGTGRAGRSDAGKRLVGVFIGSLLIIRSSDRKSCHSCSG